jgi:riboflavin synthase
MFTGIITDIGRIERVEPEDDGRRLTIATRLPMAEIAEGASIATSGICLTAIDKGEGWYQVQASGETLARTTVGDWRIGTRVNLERSLRIGDELGGHIVFGHVDAVGEILELAPRGESHRLVVSMPAELAPMVAVKGSIAIDGISFTVNEALADRFAVNAIPYTWSHTALGDKKPGDRLNLEVDMLARYVARQTAFLRER